MENLGALAILLAFCLGCYAILASLIGKWAKRPVLVLSGERSVFAIWGLLTLASGILVYALIDGRLPHGLRGGHANRAMPAIYKFAAWWGGRRAPCCCGPGCCPPTPPWWCFRTGASTGT